MSTALTVENFKSLAAEWEQKMSEKFAALLKEFPKTNGLLTAAQAPCPQCGSRDITYRKDDYTSPRAGRPDLTRAADMTWRWTCETCLTWGVPGTQEGAP